jgi:hypothetical protein
VPTKTALEWLIETKAMMLPPSYQTPATRVTSIACVLSLALILVVLTTFFPSLEVNPPTRMSQPTTLAPKRDNHAVRGDGNCLKCDLSQVAVPQSVAWVQHSSSTYLAEDKVAEMAFVSYWDRTEIANVAAKNNANGLHQLCGLPGRGNEAVLASLIANQGSGLFILLRGDSFLRIVFTNILHTLTSDPEILKQAEFDRNTYHMDHFFYCTADQLVTRTPDQEPLCTLELMLQQQDEHNVNTKRRGGGTTGHFDDSPLQTKVREHLARGDFCMAWQFRKTLTTAWGSKHQGHNNKDDDTVMRNWREARVPPNLLVINAGLHYPEADLINLGPEFKYFLELQVSELAKFPGKTHLVVLSSTFQSRAQWQSQATAYEHIRQTVAELATPAISNLKPLLMSYIDLHTLASSDRCGFTMKFPPRQFEALDPHHADYADVCGHRVQVADPHLVGGAFQHVSELLLNMLRLGKRRCDPEGPHVPAASVVGPEQSMWVTTYIGESLHEGSA